MVFSGNDELTRVLNWLEQQSATALSASQIHALDHIQSSARLLIEGQKLLAECHELLADVSEQLPLIGDNKSALLNLRQKYHGVYERLLNLEVDARKHERDQASHQRRTVGFELTDMRETLARDVGPKLDAAIRMLVGSTRFESESQTPDDIETTSAKTPLRSNTKRISVAEQLKKKQEKQLRRERKAALLREIQGDLDGTQHTQPQTSEEPPHPGELMFEACQRRAQNFRHGSLPWAAVILGVAPDASPDTAKLKYKERARAWHPDVSHPKLQEAMVWLNLAWNIFKAKGEAEQSDASP